LLKKISLAFIAASLWLIIVTMLLCLPGTEFPKSTWLEKIWFDKWVHTGLFLVLAFSWCWYFYNKQPGEAKIKTVFIRVTFLSIIYGILMELIQQFFIPFRGFEFTDILADAGGSMAGYFIAKWKWLKIKPANSGS
jgi:VanZ family protein